MERSIKFRGKRLDNGEWVYGDLLRISAQHTRIIPPDYWLLQDFISETKKYSVALDTVGQFIDLHDKKHREIYDGDILKEYSTLPDEEPRITKVDWADTAFVFINQFETWFYFHTTSPKRIEVIGNIHDNPELFKFKEA